VTEADWPRPHHQRWPRAAHPGVPVLSEEALIWTKTVFEGSSFCSIARRHQEFVAGRAEFTAIWVGDARDDNIGHHRRPAWMIWRASSVDAKSADDEKNGTVVAEHDYTRPFPQAGTPGSWRSCRSHGDTRTDALSMAGPAQSRMLGSGCENSWDRVARAPSISTRIAPTREWDVAAGHAIRNGGHAAGSRRARRRPEVRKKAGRLLSAGRHRLAGDPSGRADGGFYRDKTLPRPDARIRQHTRGAADIGAKVAVLLAGEQKAAVSERSQNRGFQATVTACQVDGS